MAQPNVLAVGTPATEWGTTVRSLLARSVCPPQPSKVDDCLCPGLSSNPGTMAAFCTDYDSLHPRYDIPLDRYKLHRGAQRFRMARGGSFDKPTRRTGHNDWTTRTKHRSEQRGGQQRRKALMECSRAAHRVQGGRAHPHPPCEGGASATRCLWTP